MKTFDKKDVYSWSNAEDAKVYIGKSGYFADSLKELQEYINKNYCNTLSSIDFNPDTDVDSIFSITEIDYKNALFLPADKVKEVEKKKWRAFRSFKEFSENLKKRVGSEITYRNKDVPLRVITTTIIGFIEEANREDQLQIGGGALKLSTWFKEIEIFNEQGKWQPFGVEE